MSATLNQLSFAEVQAAIALAAGRPVCQADRMEMTNYGDCVRNDFWWNDGACYSLVHDTKEEAIEHARANGFYPH